MAPRLQPCLREITYKVAPFDEETPVFQSIQSHGPFATVAERDEYRQKLLERRRGEGFGFSPYGYDLMKGDIGIVLETNEDDQLIIDALEKVWAKKSKPSGGLEKTISS